MGACRAAAMAGSAKLRQAVYPITRFDASTRQVSVKSFKMAMADNDNFAIAMLPSCELNHSRSCTLHSAPRPSPNIDAVMKAQGQGCSPGILGVAIGGDRVTGYEHSKAMLMRTLGAPHPHAALTQLEADLTRDLNTLGIGPMGYGGKTTVLGLFIDELYRHPASFFVSVSYMCWSSRRRILTLDTQGRPHFN